MPLVGSTMSNDAGSPIAASTSVFEENMTWIFRSTGGPSSSVNDVYSRSEVNRRHQQQQQQQRHQQQHQQHRIIKSHRHQKRVDRQQRGYQRQIADTTGGTDKGDCSIGGCAGTAANFHRPGGYRNDGRTDVGLDGAEERPSRARVYSGEKTSVDFTDVDRIELDEIGFRDVIESNPTNQTLRNRSTVESRDDIVESGYTITAAVASDLANGDGIETTSSVDNFKIAKNSSDCTWISEGAGGSTESVGVSTRTCIENAGEAVDENSDLVTVVDGDLLFHFKNIMEDIDGPFNDTFNDSLLYDYNSSLYNGTYVFLEEGLYPSGYSLLQIILASILATLLMIVIVVGNMLVIIAIATEKSLKNIQNWFIASLAVADFFLGLIIMPFSLANEIMGYWIFGYWWCDIYSAMDVLLCTASIMNLCLISLDRYWSITQAIEYLKKRTPARAALMIALVWLMSALVCIPPLLGWKRPTPEEEYPKCKLSEDIGYVLYSALGSFYIPSCIMVFVYIRIYFAAKARARRAIRKPQRPRPAMPPESPDIRQTSFTQSTPATDTRRTPGSALENVATIENQPVQIPIVTCDFASDVSTSEVDAVGCSMPMEEKDTLKVSAPTPMPKSILKASLSVNGSDKSEQSMRCRAPSVGIDVDMVSEFASSSDSGVVSRCAVVKPLKIRLCQPIFGKKSHSKSKREHAEVSKHSSKDDITAEPKPKPRDPEREKRRLARKKEKRATLILGFIMGSFIACWLPFFVLYIVKPLFPDLDIPGQAFVIAFWLGYMNSALNPFIYTVFNKDFRQAFHRILLK